MKYIFIAPLIIPKLKRGLNCKNLIRFEFLYNKTTKKQFLRVEDESGRREIEGTINIENLINSKYGKMLIGKIDDIAPGWEQIFGIIDTIKKEIVFIILDSNGKELTKIKY